jgi:hypothetical protein
MGWGVETTVAIEAGDLAVVAVQTERLLQPFDFGDALGDRPIRGPAIGVVEQDAGGGAKRRSLPSMQARRVLRLVAGWQEW